MSATAELTLSERIDLPAFPMLGLFVAASALLVLMCAALQPVLVLPAGAFILMAGLTHRLGKALYSDLAASESP